MGSEGSERLWASAGSEQPITVRLPLLLSGLYVAGLFCVLLAGRLPVVYGTLVDQWSYFVLVASGSLTVAVILLVSLRKKPFTIAKTKAIVAASIASAVLSSVFFILSGSLEDYALIAETGAIFFAGTSIPFNMIAWALAFKTLNFRSILINSSAVFLLAVLVAGLSLLIAQNIVDLVPFYFALVLLAGSSTMVLSKKTMYESVEESASVEKGHISGEAGGEDAQEYASPLKNALSLPVLGAALYTFITGLTFEYDQFSDIVYTLISGGVMCVLVIVAAVVLIVHLPERSHIFAVYGLFLPAIAVLAIIIKLIPIDFISYTIFQGFTIFFYQALVLAAWTNLVSLARMKSIALAPLCSIIQIVISLALLSGLFLGVLGYPIDLTILGLLTAVFLLYSIFMVGRNIFLFVRGPETAEELEKKPLDIEAACIAISQEYSLSPRESEVLGELAHGHSSSYVAKVLVISNNTARTHMKNIYRKLNINSREDLLELIRAKRKEEQ